MMTAAGAVQATTKRAIDQLVEELYCGRSPWFAGLDPVIYIDPDHPHTNLPPPLIAAILEAVNPALWLEIGSMVGGSAIRTATEIKRLRLPTEIICVDPFCGYASMWEREKALREANEWLYVGIDSVAQPTIYRRFLANLIAADHQDIVLPIPVTSLAGMSLLKRLHGTGRLGALPDVIYLDAGQEPGETMLELSTAWDLLPPGGVLFGDDWDREPVRADVQSFWRCEAPDVDYETIDRIGEKLKGDASTWSDDVLLYANHWLIVKE